MQTVSSQQNKRISELAVLPVFFDLRGKRVVVIGGSEPAAWKIELLAAAGARVDVFAEEVCEELSALAPTSILPHPRLWTPADLEGAALAIADIEDDAEAHAFAAAAKASAVPYNVIDRPEFCQFQFGAIVNRSPVVVGISTAGGAPILGQAVRRRIETLLPQTLTQWAQLAARLRETVMDKLVAGPQRRAFWERLADNAFGSRAPDAGDEDISFAAQPATGRVTLVGAGPGDAELLTIKAVRALQSADVILFDDLVSSEVLELARREAKRMLVGKRAQRESCAQDEINARHLFVDFQTTCARCDTQKPDVRARAFNFHLDYFNSSSNKYILRLIQEIGNHSNVSVNWYYDEIDEAMRDAGEDYRENVAVPFNMCPVED